MQSNIRKTQLSVEEIWHEGGSPVTAPIQVATALAVIENPFSGRYEPDSMEVPSSLPEQGRAESGRPGDGAGVNSGQARGKGAVVGQTVPPHKGATRQARGRRD